MKHRLEEITDFIILLTEREKKNTIERTEIMKLVISFQQGF